MLNKLNFSNAINWWTRGLVYLFPIALSEVFNSTPELITIEFKEQDVLFKRYTPESKEALEYRQFNTKDDIEKASVLSWLQGQKTHKAIITALIFPDDFFLKRKWCFLRPQVQI